MSGRQLIDSGEEQFRWESETRIEKCHAVHEIK
jgi:hypothetical protein